MKLNIISNDWHPSDNKGGSEKSLFDILIMLKRIGNTIQLGYTIDGNLIEAYKSNGIEIKKILRSNVSNKYNPIQYLQLIFSAFRFTIKNNTIIYINSFYDAPLAAVIKFFYSIPICCHLRIPPDLSRQYVFALKYVDSFIVASDKMKELYSKIGIPINKFTVIPNGFLFDNINHEQKVIDKETFKIIYLGRIAKEKGILELIQAFQRVSKKYPNIKLFITGPSISKANIIFQHEIQILIKQLSLENKIQLSGPVDDPIKYLATFDLCVFPSLIDEAFGRVIVESIIAGTPVICHNVGSVDKILNDAEHIWIYETMEELAEKILQYINNPVSYDLNSKFKFMKKQYDMELIGPKINAHLNNVFNKVKKCNQ